jgi:hypothetical protein
VVTVVDADREKIETSMKHRCSIGDCRRTTAGNDAPAPPILSIERIHIVVVIIDADSKEIETILKYRDSVAMTRLDPSVN